MISLKIVIANSGSQSYAQGCNDIIWLNEAPRVNSTHMAMINSTISIITNEKQQNGIKSINAKE